MNPDPDRARRIELGLDWGEDADGDGEPDGVPHALLVAAIVGTVLVVGGLAVMAMGVLG